MAPPKTANAVVRLLAGLGATLLGAPLPATGPAPDHGPAAEVRRLQQALLDLERAAPETGAAERYDRLAPLVRATHDLPFMARLVLGPDWASLDDDQRLQFSELFARLAIASYAERFRGLGDERFIPAGERELRGGRAEVRSVLQSPDGSTIPFTYVLHQPAEQGWRIINILAEGVSELALQRSEYRQVLAEQGWQNLVEHMTNKSELVDY